MEGGHADAGHSGCLSLPKHMWPCLGSSKLIPALRRDEASLRDVAVEEEDGSGASVDDERWTIDDGRWTMIAPSFPLNTWPGTSVFDQSRSFSPPCRLSATLILASSGTHRRRVSSSQFSPASDVDSSDHLSERTGATTAFPAGRGREVEHLTAIPDTPGMLSRSPSPQVDGGWSTPGLHEESPSPSESRKTSSRKAYGQLNGTPSWSAAQARTAQVHAFTTSPTNGNGGFLRRSVRQLSASLPRFYSPMSPRKFSEREKLGRGRWQTLLQNYAVMIWRIIWRLRIPLAIILAIVLATVTFYVTPLHDLYLRNLHQGGGNNFVMILGANPGGGVMEWKGPREWAIERDSVRNKRRYAKRWGYNLEIVDMSTKKRYAHEWRESWEKVDTIRRLMREYPDAEWFWWLDLNTFIMEPSISLQSHIFNSLADNSYRDINLYNPLNISHPFTDPWLDPLSRSLSGDSDPSSINLLIPQDCSGFNLGSFFLRRSAWTERLLDVWWDPVHYEQKHMQWEHKEQDALEYLYKTHPWIRSHTAFLPQRKCGSFPAGACGRGDPNIHYQQADRDFMVSFAGCEWGRDCWGEMYTFRELSNFLNRTRWEKFKDGISDFVKKVRGTPLKKALKLEIMKMGQKPEEAEKETEAENQA